MVSGPALRLPHLLWENTSWCLLVPWKPVQERLVYGTLPHGWHRYTLSLLINSIRLSVLNALLSKNRPVITKWFLWHLMMPPDFSKLSVRFQETHFPCFLASSNGCWSGVAGQGSISLPFSRSVHPLSRACFPGGSHYCFQVCMVIH